MNNHKDQRNKEIRKMVKKGSTYAQVAAAHGITRQRAHQIVKLSTPKKLDGNNVKEYNETRFVEESRPLT